MKHLALGIALAFLPACVVGTPVAEETKPTDQARLRADIGPMCENKCQLQVQCGIDTRTDCPDECRNYMAAFVDHGDACATLGRSLVNCATELDSCDTITSAADCDVPPEQHEQCASAGSVGPPEQVSCDGDSGTSSGVAPTPDGGARTTDCDVYMGECSDNAEYRVSCRTVDDALVCNCFRDGIVSGVGFTPSSGDCPTKAEINEPCGWNIAH